MKFPLLPLVILGAAVGVAAAPATADDSGFVVARGWSPSAT
jgi:hypothetical protein